MQLTFKAAKVHKEEDALDILVKKQSQPKCKRDSNGSIIFALETGSMPAFPDLMVSAYPKLKKNPAHDTANRSTQ